MRKAPHPTYIFHDHPCRMRGSLKGKGNENVSDESDTHPLSSAFAPPASRITPWGTGHAILVAEEAVTGPFAAINADNFYGASSFGLLADYLQVAKDQDMATYVMVGFVLRDTLSEFGSVSRAVCRLNAEGFLESVTELSRIIPDGDQA